MLSCNCFPDTFSEKAGQWTITHHCKEVWMSGRTCYAKGARPLTCTVYSINIS